MPSPTPLKSFLRARSCTDATHRGYGSCRHLTAVPVPPPDPGHRAAHPAGTTPTPDGRSWSPLGCGSGGAVTRSSCREVCRAALLPPRRRRATFPARFPAGRPAAQPGAGQGRGTGAGAPVARDCEAGPRRGGAPAAGLPDTHMACSRAGAERLGVGCLPLQQRWLSGSAPAASGLLVL